MTTISVTSPKNRINCKQRAQLVESLTDAVLEVEIGRLEPIARQAFQVLFVELAQDAWGVNGKLLSEPRNNLDVIIIEIAVMDANWSGPTRAIVIANVFKALTEGLGMAAPSDTWRIQFRVIEEGSWGSRGGVLSILDLLSPQIFTEKRIAEIRAAIPAKN